MGEKGPLSQLSTLQPQLKGVFILCRGTFTCLFKQHRSTCPFPLHPFLFMSLTSLLSCSPTRPTPVPFSLSLFAIDHVNLSLPCLCIVLISCLSPALPLCVTSSDPLCSYQEHFLFFFSGFLHIFAGALHLQSISALPLIIVHLFDSQAQLFFQRTIFTFNLAI